MKEQESKFELISKIAYIVILGVFAGVLFYLYFHQLTTVDDRFESDTLVHVSFAVRDGYYHSLAAFLYLILSKLPFMNVTISIMLSAVTVGAVVLTKELIEWAFDMFGLEVEGYVSRAMSLCANFVMGFYLSFANKAHYIGYQNANMWHNSTYLFMRLFAVVTLIYFIKIYKDIKTGISFKQWLVLSLLLAVTTGFKASFLTVFAPFFLVVLVVLLLEKVNILNLIKAGSTVFMALLVMFIESKVLFGGESSGIMIAPFVALSQRGDHPKVTIILSVLFPLVVFVGNIKDFWRDKVYSGSLLFAFIGFLEVFLFIETGDRSLDSNFYWGYSIALFVLFIFSMIKAYTSFKYRPKSTFKNILAVVQGAVLLWHVASGVWYLLLLLTGVTYFV